MENKFDLLSIGDASWDVYLTPSESESLCQIDDKECLICFSYGDKIPVKTLDFSVGGNAANNAVGSKRLGVNVGLVTTLGGDTVGNLVVEKLAKEGVDLSYLIQQPTSETNYSTVVNYVGERTIFTYHAPRSYEFPVHLPVTPWVYLTSMGETFQPFYKHIADWITANPTIKLAFNPGSWQLRTLDEIGDILKNTYLLYVNRHEAEMLTGMKDSAGKEKELLKALSQIGPKVSIITDGDNGSYVFEGNRFLKSGVLPVDAYERTGAGDAFGSGCLSAIIKGKSFEEALLWGTVNSASVIGYIGPQAGLLKEEEMTTWLDRAKSSSVIVEEF